jgi:hypothetical protein
MSLQLTEFPPAADIPFPRATETPPFGLTVPVWADFVAIDRNGTAWGFTVRPVVYEHAKLWGNPHVGGGRFARLGNVLQIVPDHSPLESVPNWRYALFERADGKWRAAGTRMPGYKRLLARCSLLASLHVLALLTLLCAAFFVLRAITHS